MSPDDSAPGQIQETDQLIQEGDWFRQAGKGAWHLQAHKEYGVVWSRCGVRMLLAHAETQDRLDPSVGEAPCGSCQTKASQDAGKLGR